MPQKCCVHTTRARTCVRSDSKIFTLPRKFTRHECITRPVRGVSMRSSCAPYKDCKRPKFGEYNVYIDRNPDNTIPIKYTTVNDVAQTIRRLEKLYKSDKYSHKRIWQVGMIMYVRLKPLQQKKPVQYKLAQKYHKFLGMRTKVKISSDRKNMVFKFTT